MVRIYKELSYKITFKFCTYDDGYVVALAYISTCIILQFIYRLTTYVYSYDHTIKGEKGKKK